MISFPTWIPNHDFHNPAFLDLFIYSDASICSVMIFPPLGNSDHVVLVFFDFPSNSKQEALSCCIAYNYYCSDFDSFCDYLRDVSWEDIFKFSASTAFCEFRVQVGIDVYICHRKYQVKSHSAPWFSAACAATIVHRNHFFVFTDKIIFLNLK